MAIRDGGKHIVLTGPVHARLAALAAELSKVKGEQVSLSSTVGELLDNLDGASRLLRDIAGARQ